MSGREFCANVTSEDVTFVRHFTARGRSVQKLESSVSYGIPVVVAKQSTKPLVAVDLAVSLTDFVARFNDPVVQALMIAFLMVMGEISGDGLSQ